MAPLQVPLQNERLYDFDRDAEPKPDQAPQTGGTVIVHGPTEYMNGALDYDGGFKLTGGLLVAAGSAGIRAPLRSTSSGRTSRAKRSASSSCR